ncbi:unnamed protein product [Soboliphyme baturini]|uniref:HRDC domain-containing protein n=1 Tax=Soboliphyme baturini TaxID=241478 RepID=A0A183ITP4_9BILA|nr:unnamed protein product [Soboliphyme baturini]
MQEYHKPVLAPNEHVKLCEKAKRNLNSRQLYALKQLCAWRNRVARVQDESLGYVLPNHMMMQIADILPREVQGILACCNPVPPLVKQELNELHRIIMNARDMPLAKLKAETGEMDIATFARRTQVELKRPHDFSHNSEEDEIVSLTQRKQYRMVLNRLRNEQKSVLSRSVSAIVRILQKKVIDSAPDVRRVIAKVTEGWTLPFDAYKRAVETAEESPSTEASKKYTETPSSAPSNKQEDISKGQNKAMKPSCSASASDVGSATKCKRERTIEEDLLSAPLEKQKKRFPKPWVSFEPFDYSAVSPDMFSKRK